MEIMLVATMVVAVTNVLLVGLYIFNLIHNNKVVDTLLNKLMAKNYNEYANYELAKNQEKNNKKVKVDKNKNFIPM